MGTGSVMWQPLSCEFLSLSFILFSVSVATASSFWVPGMHDPGIPNCHTEEVFMITIVLFTLEARNETSHMKDLGRKGSCKHLIQLVVMVSLEPGFFCPQMSISRQTTLSQMPSSSTGVWYPRPHPILTSFLSATSEISSFSNENNQVILLFPKVQD